MTWLRTAAVPAAFAVVGAIFLTLLGVQREFAWGWGLLVAALALILRIRIPDDPRADAPGRPAEQSYVGSDVSRLAWSIDSRTGTVTETVTRRVRATLTRRLARIGVDVEAEDQRQQVDQHLGDGLWDRLNGRPVTVADIRDGLAAAERLAAERPRPHAVHASAEASKERTL